MSLNDMKESFINHFRDVFTSQDSRYFLLTALKFTIVPVISFFLVFYSLWTIMEMNFNFFVANGFAADHATFYDIILMNINEYIMYFSMLIIVIFMFGLFVSFLALRAFDHIGEHTLDLIDDIDSQLIVSKINENKIIYQVSRIFFKYIQLFIKNKKRPNLTLPAQLENLKSPPLDKVFLIQYSIIVGIICLSISILLFSFTNELYQEIVAGGLDLLSSNKIVGTFLDSQKNLLFNIYMVALISNILAYIYISRSIYHTVDGVSYGFARDMIRVIKGEHNIRLKPRNNDPGQETAKLINEVLDDVFPQEVDNRSLNQLVSDTIEEMNQDFEPIFDKMDELNQEKLEEVKDYTTLESSESVVLNMLMHGPPALPKDINSSDAKLTEKKTKKSS